MADIQKTFGVLNVIPRTHGRTPFTLLDGHGYRFEIPFLEFINNTEHKWVVTIGVPCGTVLWQVGDSAEQNKSFNMVLVRTKQDIVELKEMHMILSTNEP